MSASVSYELYRGFHDKWTLDSAFNDRNQAVYEANALAGRLKGAGIKLVEERLDEDTGNSREKVIFSRKEQPDTVDPLEAGETSTKKKSPAKAKKTKKAAQPKKIDKLDLAAGKEAKKKLAQNVKTITRMEANTRNRIDTKKTRQRAAKERQLGRLKSFNSMLVPINALVWIALFFTIIAFNWNAIAANVF